MKSPCWECGEFGWNLLTSEGGLSKSNSRGLPPTKTRASFNVINAHWNMFFLWKWRQGMSRCKLHKVNHMRMDALKSSYTIWWIEFVFFCLIFASIAKYICSTYSPWDHHGKKTYPLHLYLESQMSIQTFQVLLLLNILPPARRSWGTCSYRALKTNRLLWSTKEDDEKYMRIPRNLHLSLSKLVAEASQ